MSLLFYEQASCCLQLAPCHGYPTHCLIISLVKIISKETGRENPKQTNRTWTETRVVYAEVLIGSELWETVEGAGAGRLDFSMAWGSCVPLRREQVLKQ